MGGENSKSTLGVKPDAGNPHVRFDEGEWASGNPRRGSRLCKNLMMMKDLGTGRILRSIGAGAFLLLSAGLARAEIVEYRDYDAKTRQFTDARAECRLLTDADTTLTLESGWYAVRGDIEPNAGIKINGDVHLVLCDDSSMVVWCGYQGSAAISVYEGSSLTVYGQDKGNGFLWARCSSATGTGAGIGSDNHCATAGTVTIVGGDVWAEGGGGGGAGIGGCAFGSGGVVTVRGGSLRAVRGDDGADDIGAGRTNVEKNRGTVRISGGNLWKEPEAGWVAPGACAVPNEDPQTGDDYPWSVVTLWKVTIGDHRKVAAKWTSGDGSVTNEITGAYFEVPDGNTNVKVLFAPSADRQIYGDAEVRLGSVAQDVVFGVGNDYAVPFSAVAYVVTPIVTTNYNKYGEDVVTVEGAVTNDYPSVVAAVDAARTGDSVMLDSDARGTLTFAREGAFAIDLKGFKLEPSEGETDVVRFSGASSNSILSIANGTLSGDLRFGLPDAVPASSGFVMLGSDLVSDGDIYATGDVRVLLTDGFRSTYANGVFSTEVPLQAQEGSVFGYRHNPRDARKPGKLVFDSPDLQLVSRDGAFVVAIPPLLRKWSFDLSHWMEDIPADTPISKIALPASHDSGMVRGKCDAFGEEFGALISWAFSRRAFETQSLGIRDQLKSGCRQFDFRFRVGENDSIRTFHAMESDTSFGYYGEKLDDILAALDEFLGKNKSEFVVACLSHWAESSAADPYRTYQLVLGKIQNSDLWKKGRVYAVSDEETLPKLNEVALSNVCGKVVFLLSTGDGKFPADPAKGFWKFLDNGAPTAGCYNIYDNYSNSDDFDEMSADQRKKWRENGQDPLRKAFSLDWTLTAQPPPKHVAQFVLLISEAAFLLAGIIVLIVFLAPLGPIAWVLSGVGALAIAVLAAWGIYHKYESNNMYVDELSRKPNEGLKSMLSKVESGEYPKPSFVSLDFVDANLCKAVVELNKNLCRYAAEVVRPDGVVDGKYEKLNDAFTNDLFRAENNECAVRLLRSDEPDDANGYEVKAGYRVRLDLNGKRLVRGDRLSSNRPLLTNRGELEIVNTRAETGGFEKIGRTPDATVEGMAILNAAGCSLTVRGVAFPEGKSSSSNSSLIHSAGGKVLLEDVTLTGECTGISQSAGEFWLTNCTISTSGGPACKSAGGLVEMYGDRLACTNGSLLSGGIVLENGSAFVLRGGEVKCVSPGGIVVNGGARFEVRDGFVHVSPQSANFAVGKNGAAKLYGGCYSQSVPPAYVVDGFCDRVDSYPDFPYEIVPCRDGRLAVAEIREIANSLYGSVQEAVDEVARQGGGLTVGLLAGTHPAESIVIPAETDVTLDLQGHGIVMRGTEEPVIRNFGGLTVRDSSEGGVVTKFATNGCRAAKSGGIVFNAGVFTLASGSLRAGFAEQGGGLYNETNAYARIDGGMICDCRASDVGGGICNRGVLDLRGGRISFCTAGVGGGIRNVGDLRMTSGEIRFCRAEAGGGLSNGHDAILVGGVIADNGATADNGAGVYVDSYTQTTLCGAWVKDSIGVSSRRSSTARLRIVEGLFGESPNTAWVADGSLLVPNEDTLTQDEYPHRALAQYVAQVGSKRYATLEDAFRQTISAGREVEVKLLTDVRNVAEELPNGSWAALDLSGHWLFGAQDALVVLKSARLRVFDSAGGGTVSCLFATNDATACAIRSAGFCAVEGGRYVDRVLAADAKAVVRAGLFGQEPRAALVDPASVSVANEDAVSRQVFPFAVMARNPARFKDEPERALPLQEALLSERVRGEAIRTVEVGEDQFDVALVVPTGTRAVLDLCGHMLQGVAYEPVVAVEKGAVLTIVDSVGGGRIVKDALAFYDPERQGAVVNRGMLTLAGGTIANCVGATFGGVYNAEGATFVMSGGALRGCGSTEPTGTFKSAGGVLNVGTFWMTGGEIVDCEAVLGVVGVFNDEGAFFRQLGGEIRNGAAGVVDAARSISLVENRGDYVVVDGTLADDVATAGSGGSLIRNTFPMNNYDTRFAFLWGELATACDANAIYNADGIYAGFFDGDVTASRVSNGRVKGRVASSTVNDFGLLTGGFFADVQSNVVAHVSIPEFCVWEENADAATRDFYSSRVTPQCEAEVESGGLKTRVSLQQALNLTCSGSYTVKLVTDVKDCVVCSNTVPVTLDLNGYAITGTGKVFGDGFARSVIRNEGVLAIIDSSGKKTGFIAMPSVGESEMGGAICNLGELELDDIAIWGCRARLGGGVYNAPDATARLTNVRMTGCRASGADAGDLVLNAGTVAFEGCTLEAWVDATDASRVREGGALVNAGTATLDGCRVRGRIASLDAAPPVSIACGLFEHEPPAVYRANADEETRFVYRWEVVGEQNIVATLPGESAGVRGFSTLAGAVEAAKYGSTITIVGDVTGEDVKIHSGTTIRIGPGGEFRPPEAKDLLYDYYMVTTNFAGGKVVGYEYLLDADKVAPRVGDDAASGTPWLKLVVDEETGRVASAVINVVNAYEGLYYGVDSGASPTCLAPADKWMPASKRGSLRLVVPSAENGYFYRLRVTDHVDGAWFRAR